MTCETKPTSEEMNVLITKMEHAANKTLQSAIVHETVDLDQELKDLQTLDLSSTAIVVKIGEIIEKALYTLSKNIVASWVEEVATTCKLSEAIKRNLLSMVIQSNKKVSKVLKLEEKQEQTRRYIEEKKEKYSKIQNTKSSNPKQYRRDEVGFYKEEKEIISKRCDKISKFVIDDMKKAGAFYKTKGNQAFYFSKESNTLLEIDAFAFTAFINQTYNLNAEEYEYKILKKDIQTHIHYEGHFTNIYKFSHYSQSTNTLYIDQNNDHIIKIATDKVEIILNGTDGVLFERNNFDTFTLDNPTYVKNFNEPSIENLNAIMFNSTNFQATIMNEKEQNLAFIIWFFGLFFEELQPAKIILLLLGEKGSGKTTAIKKIIFLLLGCFSGLQKIPDKEDDFYTSLSNNYLTLFDNVDTYKKWLPDALAASTNGIKVARRKLYTTNEQIEYNTRCWIALTSREPKIKRDDIIDRMLILRVARLKTFQSESSIYKIIADNKNVIWTEIICMLRKVLNTLKNAPTTNLESNNRMADYERVSHIISQALGKESCWESVSKKTNYSQADLLISDNTLYRIIRGILDEATKEKAKKETKILIESPLIKISAKKLYTFIKEYSAKHQINIKWLSGHRALAQKLSPLLDSFNCYFIAKKEKIRGGCTVYTFKNRK